MDSAIPEVPLELIEAGTTGHLIILVGAGASFGSGMPLWKGLIELLFARALVAPVSPEIRKELEDAKSWFSKDGDLLEKASFLRQTISEDWVAESIAAELGKYSATPTGTHRELAKIPGAAFITTNYDQLLEAALEEQTGVKPKAIILSDLEGIRDFSVGQVLKLHGDLNYPETIVVALEDYLRVTYRGVAAWKQKLKQLLQKPYQVLLVGYGYSDFDLQDVVSSLKAAYGETLSGPFWLELKTIQSNTKARAFSLRPVWLQSFGQLVPWLRALAQAISDKRSQAPAVLKASIYFGKVQEGLREGQKRAGSLFQQQRFEQAQGEFQGLIDEASVLLAKDPENVELKQFIASCRVNVGSCLASLQKESEAREILECIAKNEFETLSSGTRVVLASVLAQLGERSLARAILPADVADPSVKEVLQLLEIMEGRIPTGDLGGSRMLRLHRALRYESDGQLHLAAQELLELLAGEPEDVHGALICLMALTGALRKSVWEDPGAQWIPIGQRGTIVRTIEQGFIRLDSWKFFSRQSEVLREQVKIEFYHLTRDHAREDGARRLLLEWGHEPDKVLPESGLVEQRANELAAEGKVDEALKVLPRIGHPWVDDFKRASVLAAARRFEESLNETLELSIKWPGRAPIEYVSASLLFLASRSREAIAHARAACEALPGRGFRILLAKCLLDAEAFEEAGRVLDEFKDEIDRELVRLQATAAEHLDRRRALALWSKFQEGETDGLIRAQVHLRAAELLFEVGEVEKAAERAWEAVEQGRDRLGLLALVRCAQFIRLGHKLNIVDQSRIREIIRVVETRFAHDRSAEKYRFELLAALDFPEDARPPDTVAIIEAGGGRSVPIDEARQVLQQHEAFNRSVHAAYVSGLISFESFCELTGEAAATWFGRILQMQGRGIALCTPVPVAETSVVERLEGAKILVGEIELLLLQHLGVFGRLRDFLGVDGRILIFRDVWARMVSNAASLEQAAQRVHLTRLEELLEILEQSPKVSVTERDFEGTDVEWAKSAGLPVIDERASIEWGERISPRAVASMLRDKGFLERDRGNRLFDALPPESDAVPDALTVLPPHVGVTYASLAVFHQLGALDALLLAIPERLVVSPSAHALLLRRRRDLRAGVQAAEFAIAVQKAVGAGVMEGWVDVEVERPVIPELPPLKAEDEDANLLLREPLVKALSFKQALLNTQGLLLLTVDFYVAAPLGANQAAVLALAWPSLETLASMAERMRLSPESVIYMPALVARIAPRQDVRRLLMEMAKLSFVDALDAEQLIDMGRRYSGMNTAVPAQILNQIEWMARLSGHVGAPMASVRLGVVYADAIWSALRGAFRNDPEALSETQARDLSRVLLERVEQIDTAISGALLDLVLGSVCMKAADAWRESLVEDQKQEVFVLSEKTPPGKIWAYLNEWTSESARRRVAYERSLRVVLRDIDEHVNLDVAKHARSVALLLSLGNDARGLKSPAIETISILSANWRQRPKVDRIEERLRELAGWLDGEGRRVGLNEDSFTYLASKGGRPVTEIVVPEAILLRSSGDAFKGLAYRLAKHQGALDGRAYRYLTTLAERPEDVQLRINYARMTVTAPWRLVREDPAIVRTWPWRRRFGTQVFPSSLEELCGMLSEPFPLDVDGRDLREVLAERISKGGLWADRYDSRGLAEIACEVPGLLPMFMLQVRLGAKEQEYFEDVASVLRRTEDPDGLPAARLAGDILFLRMAAARRPNVRLSDNEIDLREVVPERLLHIFGSVVRGKPQEVNHEPEGGLADVESDLLKLCGTVVVELAPPRSLSLKGGLWLTYRLFQWLWAQVEVLPVASRKLVLGELRKPVPQRDRVPVHDKDLLNPFRFGPEQFDYRLAVVLHSLSEMEWLREGMPVGECDVVNDSRSVLSPKLEELLVGVASKAITDGERRFRAGVGDPSCLGWGTSGVISDLALATLLWSDKESFFRLPSDQRIRWILELPREGEDCAGLDEKIALLLMYVLTSYAQRLSVEEKVAFEGRLRSLKMRQGVALGMIGFASLYGSGQLHLGEETRRILLENLASPAAPEVYGKYLRGISVSEPGRFASEAEEIVHRACEEGVDPVPFVYELRWAVGQAGSAISEVARAVLRKLARASPFQDDERVREFLVSVGE